MSNIGSYKNTQFSEAQKFLVLDPATGSTSLVAGSSLVDYITPNLNYVRAETTRTAAENTDYEIGVVVQTIGATSTTDGLGAVYLVVEGGTGDFPMLNGNDLLLVAGDDTLREELSQDPSATGNGALLVNGVVQRVSSRTEMKAYDVPAGYQFSLEEGGRSGLFVVKAGTPPSDPQEGIYVVLDNGNYAERPVSKSLSVKWFGAKGDETTDDTVAIQAAVTFAFENGTNKGNGTIVTSPNNFQIGQYPMIFFPGGEYHISEAITYNKYHSFYGEGATIVQDDGTKNIFFSDRIYLNKFSGLKLIGGQTQVYAKNTDSVGLEGCVLEFEHCEFNAAKGFAVQLFAGPTAGGEVATFNSCRMVNFTQAVYSTFDIVFVQDCWIETFDSIQPNDTAWFDVGRINVNNTAFTPGGNYNSSGNTCRYFDVRQSIIAAGNRFGAEGAGGLPIVYCYNDASSGPYPYQRGDSCIIRDSHLSYTGGSNRLDTGFVVLKSGIFKTTVIEGNSGSADGPFIRTNLMDGTTFSAYMASFALNTNRLIVSAVNNSKWAASLTDSSGSTDLLLPFAVYDTTASGKTTRNFGQIAFPDAGGVGTSPLSDELNAYEYGNFSFGLVGATGFGSVTQINSQECKYVKTGKEVHLYGSVEVNGTEANLAPGDYLELDGLPFAEEVTQSDNLQYIGKFAIYGGSGLANVASGVVIAESNTDSVFFMIQTVLGSVSGSSNISFSMNYIED